jgi:aerobic-type carbon monoxide dehydrogenase small subunit (CoxS/CutS family)
MKITLTINGRKRVFEEPVYKTLSELLRAHGLWSVRIGCESGDCGSCAVILDGIAVNSCLVLVAQANGKTIETYENIDRHNELAPVKEVLMDFGDADCGYCIPGMVMSVKALLLKIPEPTEEEILDALAGNICHCTRSVKPAKAILAAIKRQ